MTLPRKGLLLAGAFALAQAALYTSLLPLWEGFDEAWHYGYVQHFANGGGLPVLGKTALSKEVLASLHLVPVSHVVRDAWLELQPYDVYFRLTPEQRAAQRRALENLPREASVPSSSVNYEIQQAPLAYAVLAIPAYLLRDFPLPRRILWLRIFNAVLCAGLMFLGAEFLFRTIGLTPVFRDAGLFFIFASQMYWATTAHISSDGLAVAISVWYFGALAAFGKEPNLRRAVLLAVITALGLLTKAYFLPLAAFAIFAVALRAWRLLPLFGLIAIGAAAPWYARNWLLYGNLSGLIMSSAGIPIGNAISSLLRVPWARTIPYMLRASLWTGNNSFTTFSNATLNTLLALLAAGLLMFRKPDRSHWAVIGGSAVFAAAVIYVVGNDVIFQRGASAGASPWYTQPLLAPLIALALLGMSRRPRLGRWLAIAVCLIAAYICIATYIAKLIPLYGGYPEGRTTLSALALWYWRHGADVTSMLSTASPAPPIAIYLGTAVVSTLAVAIALRLTRIIRHNS